MAHPYSCDLDTDVEHLALSIHISVVTSQDLIPTGKLCIWHIFQAVGWEGPVIQELGTPTYCV